MFRAIKSTLILLPLFLASCAHENSASVKDEESYVVLHRVKQWSYRERGAVGLFGSKGYLADLKQGQCYLINGSSKKSLLLDSGNSLKIELEFPNRNSVRVYLVESVYVEGRIVPDIRVSEMRDIPRGELTSYLSKCNSSSLTF